MKSHEKKADLINHDDFETLFSTMAQGVVYQNSKGEITLANPAAAEILGLSIDQLCGKTSFDPGWHCIREDGTPFPGELHPSMEALRSGKPVLNVIMGIYHPVEKKHRWAVVNAVPEFRKGEDAPWRVYATITDITRLHEAEKSLIKSEKKFRSSIESSPWGMHFYRLDENGDLSFSGANPAAEKILGIRHEALLGKKISDAFPGLSGTEILEHYMRVVTTGETWNGEQIIYQDDRISGAFEVTAYLIAPGEMVAAFIDITEKKRSEIEKMHLEEQLRHSQRMESVGRLAGGIAHDFNNLLTPIIGYSDLLLLQAGVSFKNMEEIINIKNAAERARDLTKRLLAFSRKQVLDLKPVDLRIIVSGFQKILARTIRENIKIVTEIPDVMPIVSADPASIEQILMNLSINSDDAMPDGGILKIELCTELIDNENIQFYPEAECGEYVVLSISDNGTGMDKGVIERAFEPFFTTKESGKGTGLGLAIVYGTVKQHSGFIIIDSEPGMGSEFRIYLPVIESKIEAFEKKNPDTVCLNGKGETIYVVEDNDMVREMTFQILKHYKYHPVVFERSAECMKTFNEKKDNPALLITDVVMPSINGPELYEKIRLVKPDLKVLYMSGYERSIVLNEGFLGSDVHFIHKPFSPESLARKIKEVLP